MGMGGTFGAGRIVGFCNSKWCSGKGCMIYQKFHVPSKRFRGFVKISGPWIDQEASSDLSCGTPSTFHLSLYNSQPKGANFWTDFRMLPSGSSASVVSRIEMPEK